MENQEEKNKMKEDIDIILNKIEKEENKEKLFELCYELQIINKRNVFLFREVFLGLDENDTRIKKALPIIVDNPEWNNWKKNKVEVKK